MNNIVYIVIALAVLIIIAIFLLRKKDSPNVQQPTQTPSTGNQARSAATAVSHQAGEPVPTPLTPAYQERLDNAQRFIDQQRYDEAVAELKQGLITYPNQNELMIKLLNVYAISGNHAEFNDLYDTIKNQADSTTLAEANNIKAMLEAEQTSNVMPSAPVAAASAASVASDTLASDTLASDTLASDNNAGQDLSLDDDFGLEFNLEDDEPTASSAAPADTEDNVLSLDDLESQLLADDDELSDDFNIEDKANSAAPVSTLDSGLELATDSSTTNSSTNDADNEFELSLDDLDADEQKPDLTTEPVDTAPTSIEAPDDEFDFNFDEPSSDLTSADTNSPATPLADQELSLDELAETELDTDDFADFGLTEPAQPATTTQTDTDNLVSDAAIDDEAFSFDLEELESDMDVSTTAAPATQSEPTADIDNSELADFDFDLSEDFESEEPTSKEPATADNQAKPTTQTEPVEADSDALMLDEAFDINTDDSNENTLQTSSSQEDSSEDDNNKNANSDVLGSGLEDTLSQLDALSMGAAGGLAGAAVASTLGDDANTLASTEISPVETEQSIDDNTVEDNTVEDSTVEDNAVKNDLAEAATTAPASTEAPSVTEQPVVTDTVTDSDFANDFEFVNELDGTQVTLDLAAQYMDLGEYESAKRLLNEVLVQGDDTQKQQAQELLDKTI